MSPPDLPSSSPALPTPPQDPLNHFSDPPPDHFRPPVFLTPISELLRPSPESLISSPDSPFFSHTPPSHYKSPTLSHKPSSALPPSDHKPLMGSPRSHPSFSSPTFPSFPSALPSPSQVDAHPSSPRTPRSHTSFHTPASPSFLPASPSFPSPPPSHTPQTDMQLESEISSMVDMTAMILVNMKNTPTAPLTPPLATMRTASPLPRLRTDLLRADTQRGDAQRSDSPRSDSPRAEALRTDPCDCMLCTRPAPVILAKCHTWAWIMRVVFFSLRDRYPEKKFFSLKNDVYEYMMGHWGPLGLDRKPSANWHKQIQDMLSHSRNIFESGMAHFKQNGFWRLKDLEDPWTARPDTPRPPSTTPPATPPDSLPSSPRKRWKEDEEQEDEMMQIIQKKLCSPPASPRTSSPKSYSPLLGSPLTSPRPSSPRASPLDFSLLRIRHSADEREVRE